MEARAIGPIRECDIAAVLVHNGAGFCNSCITKRYLHNSANASYNNLYITGIKVIFSE
jgi:hypothetical protein